MPDKSQKCGSSSPDSYQDKFQNSTLKTNFVSFMLKSYLKYIQKRVNAHGIHSPFVFEFYNEVIKKWKLGRNSKVEDLRKILLKNNKKITIHDLGAGSRRSNDAERAIFELAKNAAVPEKYGSLMARIIEFYNIKTVLELGTSLGVGTGYLAMASAEVKVDTIEGCPETAKVALGNLTAQLGLENVNLEVGEFSEVLGKKGNKVYDLIYIDGNHQLKPTLEYFNFAINHTHDDSFIIFDDIHWSEEMEEAWKQIQSSEKINVSMDLFRFGIVCKRGVQRKEHFIIKF